MKSGGVETKGEEGVGSGDGGWCEKGGREVMVAVTGLDNKQKKKYQQLAEDVSVAKGEGAEREGDGSLHSSRGGRGGMESDISSDTTPLDELKAKHQPPSSPP